MSAVVTLQHSPFATPSDKATAITVAYGDGIGPEIMDATLRVLEAAGADLKLERIEIGEQVYRQGHSAGIEPSAWESIRRTKVFLKAPITTPQGGGYKSLNVTVRKTLGLYANVRPCVAYDPFVLTQHPGLDLVVVRENEEDLYAGIEHRQTEDVVQCLKLVSRPGCERIVRYAFEYARVNGRRKVTCMTKDNIMKLTDGLFHRVFEEIGAEYPEIEKEHYIIDIGMARAATRPGIFDVIVTPNLYGDILSDVVAEAAGSVGLAPSANIGQHAAMFEAIHGSAPQIAGQGIANPSGLMLAAVMMLVHIGQGEVAQRVHNAWLRTIEDGVHTLDVFSDELSQAKVGTAAFAEAVIERLGLEPRQMQAVRYENASAPASVAPIQERHEPAAKTLVGCDVFVQWNGPANDLAELLLAAAPAGLSLQVITNRGVKVWPGGIPETFCTDHWRCRFMAEGSLRHRYLLDLLAAIDAEGLEFVKTENLYLFDGQPGFSLAQGQ